MPTADLGLGPAVQALVAGESAARPSHALYPPRDRPRLLVPLRPGRAAAAGVRRYTTPTSAGARWRLRLGACLASLGAARLSPRTVTLGGPGTFIDYLQSLLGSEAVVSVHLGPPRANRKPVLHLMDPRGRSIAFVKLGVNELTCRRVRAESAALQQVAAVTTSNLVTPAVIHTGAWEGLEYLITAPVATWSTTSVSPALRARALEGLVRGFPTMRVPLSESRWWSSMLTTLDACDDAVDTRRLRRAAVQLLDQHGDEVLLAGAGHGDWSPWNMSPQRDHLVVWDWERFALDVPQGWDELHFALASHRQGAAAALEQAHTDGFARFHPGPASARKVAVAAYLLNRGVNFLHDRQREAGSPEVLRTWLLPALERLVGIREQV